MSFAPAHSGFTAFAATLAIRLFWTFCYAADATVSDQWDLEFVSLYKPWIEGRPWFAAIWTPVAEHMQATMRLFNLGIVALTGRWNVLDQLAAQSVIMATCAGLISYWRPTWPVAVLTVLVFAGPHAYANLFVGCASVYFFALLFAILALAAATIWNLPWLVPVFGALAYLSSANGLFTLIVGGAALVLWRRSWWGAVSVALTLAIYAYVTLTATQHMPPASWAQRWVMLKAMAGFPNWPWQYAGLLLWCAPLCAFAVKDSPRKRFALALYGWVVLNAAGIIWSRAGTYVRVENRYIDTLGVVFIAAMLLWSELDRRSLRIAGQAVLCLWVAGLGWSTMPTVRNYSHVYREIEGLERRARILDRVSPGAGLEHLRSHPVMKWSYHSGPEAYWRLINDPAAQRLRPRLEGEVLKATVALSAQH